MSVSLAKQSSVLLIEGLDASKPAEYLSSSASPNTQNFFVDRGLLTKRGGSTEKGSALSNACMAGIQLEREGSIYNVRIGLTKIQHFTAGAWADIGHADWTGGADDLFDIAIPLLSGKQILAITNGVDAIRKWTGTGNTADLGGTPPVAKFIQEYQTYLVCANIQGGVDVDTRVQWCDTANPEVWTGGNSGTKDLVEDGGKITGLNLFGNYLCIHKDTSIYLGYLVSSNAIFRFERKSTGVGTCANNSIVNLPTGEQIFLANDGIRIFNGITAPLVDAPINDEIRDSINTAYRHRAWGVLVRELDEVWLGVPIGDQTSGETVYKFNYVTRTMYKDVRNGANCAWRAAQTDSITWDTAVGTWDEQTDRWNDTNLGGETQLVYVGDTSGRSLYHDSLSSDDDGVAVDAFWETKDFEDPTKRVCRWLELELWASGGDLTAEYSVDGGNTWVAVDGSPFTLNDYMPTDESPLILYFDVLSSKIRFRFSNDNLGQSLVIKQYIVGYVPREYRR